MFSKVEPVFKSSKIIPHYSLHHKGTRQYISELLSNTHCPLHPFCSCSMMNCQSQTELSIRVSSYSSIGIRAGTISCFRYTDLYCNIWTW